ncbi:uncharacterized protein Hap1MRO34_025558 isoform 1-T3 [Clarias gariepinus]|uniref:synaptonemal complex protein 1-like isoform X1 n=2 Tax=Clarias gariepinus TaxID=13013 RepID=UPI00234C488C|nr:synaptonemal complex protein 1-like isoform X1 [Clarias gariepinus]XP_053338017.1 synaptonemal complex protein 1-like isoform X1 [Clarias gariepinus]XP_053338027.1 synaptonemal complex protein 1-like isoform X1 [Clarias gariepinus]
MDYVKRLVGFRDEDLPVRPLLLVTGAAALAGGLYYTHRKCRRGETTRPSPVQVQTASKDSSSLYSSLMSDGVSVTHTDTTIPEDPLADTETRYEQTMENNTLLESTDYDLMSKVTKLREQLSVAQTRCEELKREKERDHEAHQILEAQCKEMEEALQKRDELLKEKELEEEAHHVLASLFQEMRENFQRFEHVVEVILAQTEENYKEVMECCAQENKERSELMSKMNQLDNSVQEMSNKLLDVHNKHIKTTRDMMKTMLNEKILNHQNASLRATLAELGREYQGLLGSNAGLVADKNDLRAEVHRLQALLQDKEKELSESKERCDEMMRVSLADAERKYQEAMESNAQLEKEKSELMSKVAQLEVSVKEFKPEFFEVHSERVETT